MGQKRHTQISYVKKIAKRHALDYRWRIWLFDKVPMPVLPPDGQTEQAQFEDELHAAWTREVQALATVWEQKDKTLKSDYCTRIKAKQQLEEKLKEETEDESDALRMFSPTKEKLESFEFPVLGHGWMMFLLFLIGILELPFNLMAFQIFGLSMTETVLVGLGLAVIIPLIAHFCGKTFRQEYKTVSERFFSVLAVILVIGVSVSIALFREHFIKDTEIMERMGIRISANSLILFFAIANLMLFLGAVWVSYEGSHKHHREFMNVRRKYKNALRNFNRESVKAKVVAENLAMTERQLVKMKNYRQKEHDRFRETAFTMAEEYQTLVEIYRTTNLEWRKSGITPPCFKTDPNAVLIPEIFAPNSLKWNCEPFNPTPAPFFSAS